MRNSDDLIELEVLDKLNTIDIDLGDTDNFDTIEGTTGSYSQDDEYFLEVDRQGNRAYVWSLVSKKWRDHKSSLTSNYVRRYFEDAVWATENPDALVVPLTSNYYITDEQ
ncbi:hypothetical protein PanWU01x14_164790 [Parasponia andersonii]|uniref:Uncharacterized protein n=1 Tax=Parasponia andersonii TaxID=3476 RepID=A0A2P5CCF9_PARAD|nr:hypothetical protein PanWU01x14_164790 [Parasponia andersonii]